MNRNHLPGQIHLLPLLLLPAALLLIYWRGLAGGFLFDDFSNIVENPAVHITALDPASLHQAASASPVASTPRPLAMLSFGLNHAASGLDPFWMKLTNLGIHALNAWLVWWLALRLLALARPQDGQDRHVLTALLLALGWAMLPINLSPILMVVQRMELLAHTFVLAGLAGYIALRQRQTARPALAWLPPMAWLLGFTALGLLSKESAVLTPAYAFILEATLLLFRSQGRPDTGLRAAYGGLAMVGVAACVMLLPKMVDPAIWEFREFTLAERLLTQARVWCSYIGWTLLPLPGQLSFYHDDYPLSRNLLTPWTTLPAMLALASMAAIALHQRSRRPLLAIGLGWYLSAHLVTGTVLPLEMIFEHRNYFASLGLLLVVIPPLVPRDRYVTSALDAARALALGGLLLWWAGSTALLSNTWSHPLRLAEAMAAWKPDSPRSRYEFGRNLVVASGYREDSPLLPLAEQVLWEASALPRSTSSAESGLLILAARTGREPPDEAWHRMETKLKLREPSMQDIGALRALVRCQLGGQCTFPDDRLDAMFSAALGHTRQPAVLMAVWADLWMKRGEPARALPLYRGAFEREPEGLAYLAGAARAAALLGDEALARSFVDTLRQHDAPPADLAWLMEHLFGPDETPDH